MILRNSLIVILLAITLFSGCRSFEKYVRKRSIMLAMQEALKNS